MLCEAHFPFTAGTTSADISAALQKRSEFHPTGPTSWNWLGSSKSVATVAEPAQDSPSPDFWSDDGVLVLGDLRLKDKALVLGVNSRQRSDRGCALLSEILGPRVGPPLINIETIEQIRASRGSEAPDRLDLSDEQHRAIVHDQLNRHYREVLDQPVPMLGGQTPREAIKTAAGRRKAADWLKYMENRTAKAADPGGKLRFRLDVDRIGPCGIEAMIGRAKTSWQGVRIDLACRQGCGPWSIFGSD